MLVVCKCSFVRKYQSVLQNGYTILHSHQQWVWIPGVPHSLWYLALPGFDIFTIRIGGNCISSLWLQWWTFLVVLLVKNLPAMQETPVQFLGWEDLLEEGKGTHSSIRAWRILWTEEPGGLYSPWGRKESDTHWVTKHSTVTMMYDVEHLFIHWFSICVSSLLRIFCSES